jgi:spore coat polysaccharide biosynthesis protein SpsF
MFGARVGAKVFRGTLHNVVERFRLLADAFEAKAVVRISGDSPFIDPALIKRAVEIGCDTDSDLVTNVLTRTFPKGQSVEILSREVLDRLASMTLSDFDKEHVTTRIYKEPSAYQILSFESSEEYGEVQLSVDTPADLELAIRLDRKMNGDVVGWRELVTAKEALDGE